MTKICKRCGEMKIDFHQDSRYPDGLRTWCKQCVNSNSRKWYAANLDVAKEVRRDYYQGNKESNRARINFKERLRCYNITELYYREMLSSQGNKCAITGCEEKENLVIDHDHSCCPFQGSCGKCVRGLLCPSHNYGLGNFKDSSLCLQGAIEYLKKHR